MPIKVTCACGQSFAAKDELAGRTVKCPKCSRPLVIPKTGAAGGAPAAPTATRPQQSAAAAGPAPAAPPAPAYPSGGLFDEVGLPSAPTGTIPCPGCRTPMPMGAIVCVQCGYNMKLGRRMETLRIGADGTGESGSVTDMFLARAARTLEEDKEEERKKTREGLPWWAYLLMLLGLVGFMAMMMMIPQRSAIVAGGALIFVGQLLCLYSGICILVAFRKIRSRDCFVCSLCPAVRFTR
jgi:ssDNA-binding Zn-finger/Zn-ribbon topoisomerase 1